MKLLKALSLLTLLVACKSSNHKSSDLAATPTASATAPNTQQGLAALVGKYEFVGPETAYSLQNEGKATTRDAEVYLIQGESKSVALRVNFYRTFRGSGFIEPGVAFMSSTDGKVQTDTYKVGSDDWFGGSSSEERKTETIGIISDNTVTKTEVMWTRPYKWFNKPEWAKYKTVVTVLNLKENTLTLNEQSADVGMPKNAPMILTFKKK